MFVQTNYPIYLPSGFGLPSEASNFFCSRRDHYYPPFASFILDGEAKRGEQFYDMLRSGGLQGRENVKHSRVDWLPILRVRRVRLHSQRCDCSPDSGHVGGHV